MKKPTYSKHYERVRSKEYRSQFADAMHRGRELHPEWGHATGAMFKTKTGQRQTGRTRYTAEACAAGFAETGGFRETFWTPVPAVPLTEREFSEALFIVGHKGPVLDPEDGIYWVGVVTLNDKLCWSLERIELMLRRDVPSVD